jgi:hypothetical protein
MEMARLVDAAWILSVEVNAKSGINSVSTFNRARSEARNKKAACAGRAGRGGILMMMDGVNRHNWRPDDVAILRFYTNF